MKYIAAYAMVAISGKEVTAQAVQKVLEAVGCKVDNERLNQLCESLKGKALNEVIAAGMGKVGSMSAGAAPAQGAAAPVKEEKQPEPEEEEEEEDVDMGGLFGDF